MKRKNTFSINCYALCVTAAFEKKHKGCCDGSRRSDTALGKQFTNMFFYGCDGELFVLREYKGRVF